jgi:segregation and condensation protein A
VLENTIQWWRKALNLALGGIRSGFGLFPRPAKPEPVTEPMFSDSLEETLEDESALTEPPPQPEIAIVAPPILAEPEAPPAAEPVPAPAPEMSEAGLIDTVPAGTDPAETAEAEAGIEPIAEPVESEEAAVGTEPEAAGTAEAEAENEPVAEPVESEEAVVEAEPEAAGTAEAEAENEPVAEPVESEEAVVEAEPEAAGTAEAEAENEPVAEPVERAERAAEELEPEGGAGFNPREMPIESTRASQPEEKLEIEPALHQGTTSVVPQMDENKGQAIQVAEKGLCLAEIPERHTAEAKARVDSTALTARLKSCPDTCGNSDKSSSATSLAPEGRILPVSPTIPSLSAVAEPIPEAENQEAEPEDGNEETEPMNETIPEPAERIEAVVESSLEATPEPVPAPAIGDAVLVADPPVAVADATPLFEPPPAVAPTPAPEPEPTLEPVHEPAPTPDAAASLVLTTQPTADEKAAAKLAARQKKLDESSEQSPFSVIVGQVYDGPLDLLLDLIRKQDIDIYDIPIARITAQFLAYVNQLKAGDVDVAGEFIYTASLLIHIKSRMLLPRAASAPEEAAEDPRRELVERLLEHERFKNAAQMLQQKQMLEAATWSNPGVREFQDDAAAEPEIAADTVDLVRIFSDILERARKRPVLDVSEDTVTVGQMIQFLARRLTMEDKPVALRRLLSHTRSERALIAMFLALLELVRMQAVLLRQDRQFSEIFIKKHTGFDAAMNEGLVNARDDWR